MHEVTRLLESEPHDSEALLGALYSELRRMAAQKMAGERPGHTLQATALVHEAYLRLAPGETRWENRRHFFGAAAEAMRRILVESARKRKRLKRGGPDAVAVTFDEARLAAPAEDERVLQVHAALDRLADEDETMAQVVKLRFFAGLTGKEIADLLGIAERTVGRQWSAAKVWLFQAIRDENA